MCGASRRLPPCVSVRKTGSCFLNEKTGSGVIHTGGPGLQYKVRIPLPHLESVMTVLKTSFLCAVISRFPTGLPDEERFFYGQNTF